MDTQWAPLTCDEWTPKWIQRTSSSSSCCLSTQVTFYSPLIQEVALEARARTGRRRARNVAFHIFRSIISHLQMWHPLCICNCTSGRTWYETLQSEFACKVWESEGGRWRVFWTPDKTVWHGVRDCGEFVKFMNACVMFWNALKVQLDWQFASLDTNQHGKWQINGVTF